jgi:hypothetical protein
VTWDPLRDKVTIHALAIIRDGKRIDVLQGGKDVLVLRREKNMERAMLDGRMSASIQIKDLQVGDLIDWSYTQERRDPRGRRSHQRFRTHGLGGQDRPVSRAPAVGRGRAAGLEGLDRLPRAQAQQERQDQRTAGRCFGLSAPKPPVGAPAAFPAPGRVCRRPPIAAGKTSPPAWRRCTPRARPWPAGLADPRRGRRHCRRFADPKVRAFAALRLVEDKTRYLFLGMGDGGYKPAPADETWSRRFGDCKGKTVLLLAPAARAGDRGRAGAGLATPGGDGLDQRVPAAAQFNHVLVRARIAGKAYWLDGTRSGDKGGLDDLEPPPFRWGLPVRDAGAALEPIDQRPLTQPNRELTLRLDASAGLDKPAAATMTLTACATTARVSLARSIESTPGPTWSAASSRACPAR